MRDGVTVSCLQALALTSLCVYCLAHVLIWGMGEQIIPIFPSVFPQMFSHYLDQWFFHKTRCTKVNQQINHNSRGRLFIFFIFCKPHQLHPSFRSNTNMPAKSVISESFSFFIFGLSIPIPPSDTFLSYPPPSFLPVAERGGEILIRGKFFFPKKCTKFGCASTFCKNWAPVA